MSGVLQKGFQSGASLQECDFHPWCDDRLVCIVYIQGFEMVTNSWLEAIVKLAVPIMQMN